MNISMRSQLTAGAALLGATAIAITPITQPGVLTSAENAAQRVAAAVSLTSLVNPVNAIAEVVEDANTNIFYNDGWGAPWNAIPGLSDYAYAGYVGILPDFAYWPLPIATTVVTNLSGYAWAGIRGVGDFANKTFQAVWNTPFAVVDAVQLVIAGHPDQALALLQQQIVLPLQKAVNSALNSVAYIANNIVENIGIVGNALSTIVVNLAASSFAGASFIATAAIDTLTTAFGQLTSGQFENAWNTAVNGFLGRNGTLGYIEKLTIGPGVETGVPATPIIPSVRAVLTQSTRELGDSFYNFPYDPAAGPFQPATAAVAPAKAAVSTFSAPVAAATTGDGSSAGSDVKPDVAKPEVKADNATTSDAPSTGSDNSSTPGDNGTAGSSSNGSTKTGSKHTGTGGTKRAAKASASKSSE